MPGDMTYEEWKKAYVDGGSKSGLTAVGESGILFPMKEQDVTREYQLSATPGQGAVTYGVGYSVPTHTSEVRMAAWLRDTFGGDVRLLTEVNAQKVKTADFLWRGRLWDLKTVSTEKAANFAIRKGLKQIRENPGGIILDYRGHAIDLDELAKVISKRVQWRHSTTPVDIIVILDDGLQVWRY